MSTDIAVVVAIIILSVLFAGDPDLMDAIIHKLMEGEQ
jgi:hypothetical protein